MIRRNRRQINPEIEAGGPEKHDGQDCSSRADQVDVSPSHVCGNEQSARGPRQGKPSSFEDVRPLADSGAGVPWVGALDHCFGLSPKGKHLPLVGGRADDADLEMPLRVGDDLGIAGMVGGFNRDNSTADCRIALANIFCEFDFSAGRSEDQDFSGIADGVQGLFEEFLAFMDMAAADRVGLVMNMPRRHVGMQDDFIEAGKAEVEDPSLQVIDPDDRVKMVLH